MIRRGTICLVLVGLALGGNVYGQTQTPGQVAKFGPAATVVDSSITEDATGNVGVGTKTPAAKLQIAGGNLSLDDSTAATGNILKGGSLFIHNFGAENTFIGSNAGNLSMTGSSNTASGFWALTHNTSGEQNTANGGGALYNNTIGSFNTAMALTSLFSNDSGSYNTATGYATLLSNTDGEHNTASGARALYSTDHGSNNTATGSHALFGNTTGEYNTAHGVYSLYTNSTGTYNSAHGPGAMFSNTTGSQNTASGHSALYTNTTGEFNTAIGMRADVSQGDLTNATVIGAQAVVDASNKIRLGNAAVTVIEGQVPYTFVSDRRQKESFQPVDGEEVLKKLRSLNIASWNYIGHDPLQFRHYGAVAQEFFEAFGHDAIGTIGSPTTINSGDLDGILMIAVQTLEKRTAENADLRARIEALERLVKGLTAPEK